ncbi:MULTISPECIES: hypothetical protein [unclassified Novosphingobium]|uniref:hypothetical protein n=1 Tax=unclassified Novosphingobium TaxID=2644732 RepID=UPI00135BC5A4|nr:MULTISPECIES: hypothetical protein [unclassified Novosphingobium]
MIDHTPTAMRRHWHGKIKPLLEDDAVWQPTYNALVAVAVTPWIVAGVLFLFVRGAN